ncbi:MAG: hypothetical protein GY836_00025, partial [Herbaspirillum sp.]|uniref:hypothetical protein n=1 Tax=Herbaspirillum sp. TaxID=1890675 RepID=UPI00258D7512
HDLEAAYLRVFPDMRCIARASRFKPREVPAVLTETRDAKARREMEQVKDNVALPRFLRDMVKGFLDERRDPLTLHLNADNPIIRTLAARQTLRDEVAGNTLVALYNNALLLLARAISPENVRVMFEQHNRVLDLLLSGIEERDQLARERQAMETQLRELAGTSASSELTPHVTCFVAMPFRDELRGVYEAIEAVLEDVPFLWSVTRADERTRHP